MAVLRHADGPDREDTFTLSCWGSWELRYDDGSLVEGLVGRKIRALVSYLAFYPSRFISRDEVSALLWPESDTEQARASLRQAIRSILVSGLISTLIDVERRALRLRSDVLSTEVDQLRDLIARREASTLAQRLSQLSGPLFGELSGISEPFDDWLRTERALVDEVLREGSLEVARATLAAGDRRRARELLLALERFDPAYEPAAQAFIGMETERGDVVAAERRYARLAETLRTVLDVAPSSETEALVRSRPCPEPPATDNIDEPRSEPVRTVPNLPRDHTGKNKRVPPDQRRAAAIAVGAVMVGFATMLSFKISSGARTPSEETTVFTVEVRPFSTTVEEADAGSVADAFRMRLADSLASQGIISLSVGGPNPQRTVNLVARGSVDLNDGGFSAAVRILPSDEQEVLWSRSYTWDGESTWNAAQQFGDFVAPVIGCAQTWITHAKDSSQLPRRQQIFEICEGLSQMNGIDLVHRLDTLASSTVENDPSLLGIFALALYHAAEVTHHLEGPSSELVGSHFARAIAKLHTARQLDPENPFVRLASGYVAANGPEWNERYFALRSLTEDTHTPAFICRFIHYLRATGHLDHALLLIDAGLQQNPRNTNLLNTRSLLLSSFGHRNEAEAISRRVHELAPKDGYLEWQTFVSEALYGDAGIAIEILSAGNSLGWFHLETSEKNCWINFLHARLDTGVSFDPQLRCESGRFSNDGYIVRMLAVLGRTDDALAIMHRLDKRFLGATIPFFYPELEGVRRQAGFVRLVEEIGLADHWATTGRWPDFCRTDTLPYKCEDVFDTGRAAANL